MGEEKETKNGERSLKMVSGGLGRKGIGKGCARQEKRRSVKGRWKATKMWDIEWEGIEMGWTYEWYLRRHRLRIS